MPSGNDRLPAISVVMPNYNHEAFLPRSLGAILPQLREDDELIIVDDCSKDGSRALLAEYAARHRQIVLLLNEKNMGPIPSVTRALAAASRPLIAFQSADDMVLPGFLATARENLGRFPLAAFFLSDPCMFSAAEPEPKALPLKLSDGPRYFSPADFMTLQQRAPFNVWGHSSVFRREMVIAAGAFRASFRWHADWFLYQVLSLRHGFCYAPLPLAAFWVDDASYSRKSARDIAPKLAVITEMLETAKSTPYADVWPALRKSRVFATSFARFMPRILLRRPDLANVVTPGWLGVYAGIAVRKLSRAFRH